MKANQIYHLIQVGAHDRVRAHLKRLALNERIPLLHECWPFVNASPAHLKFFRNHFSQELGALVTADYDYARAETLYRSAKTAN